MVDTVFGGLVFDPSHVSTTRGQVAFSVDSTVLTWTIDTLPGGETFYDLFVVANYEALIGAVDTLPAFAHVQSMDQVDTVTANDVAYDTTFAAPGQQQDAQDFAQIGPAPLDGGLSVVQPPIRDRPFRSRGLFDPR